ncbi:MAG: protease modulator HflC [Alphaproteobacteria bacterium]|nr:protease modulator HflC [Alphaproteobacteria bacterium]MDX5370613.1 protease modulator HflC [Alphaproteobacteria bacterium]MDX5465057.1 protease modulator HflC [Alphaproteobacteria bacterium]
MTRTGILIGLVIAVLIVASSALFTVRETEQALVLRFGRIIGEPITEPGLKFKVPFVDNVELVDKRVLMVETQEEEIITADKKRILMDAFARFRIVDPLLFYQTVRTELALRSRLETILNSSLRGQIGRSDLFSVLSGERAQLMQAIQQSVNTEAASLGINILDVRIRRADLPTTISESIYARMRTEREREAQSARSEGEEEARRIRARADRTATVLLAEARRDGNILRGQGDAERNRIFAEAYSQDPTFFTFYRSMQAYREAMSDEATTFVLSPDSQFFRYFGSLTGNGDSDALAAPK